MKSVQRLITNICSDNPEETKMFYTTLFNLQVEYDSDWFIQLKSKDHGGFELGIIDRSNALVPDEFQTPPNGFYLSFVVDSADDVFETSKSKGYTIIKEPHDTFYGQRRLLLKDPSGSLVDVSSPIPNFSF